MLGASFDTVEANHAFAEAQEFPYRLLSDVDHVVGAAYAVTRPAGEKFSGFSLRHSFLIDPDGVIRAVYNVTDVATHAETVLNDLPGLQRGAD